jgi:hypothetical protein
MWEMNFWVSQSEETLKWQEKASHRAWHLQSNFYLTRYMSWAGYLTSLAVPQFPHMYIANSNELPWNLFECLIHDGQTDVINLFIGGTGV